jgi:hypothetical protein
MQERVARHDLVAEGQVDGAVLGRQGEEHGVGHDALHPTNHADGDHRKPGTNFMIYKKIANKLALFYSKYYDVFYARMGS